MIMSVVIPVILGLAVILAFLRLITLKRASGKAVVLDVLTTITTGLLVIFGLVFDTPFLLDIALIYAILSFASVLVIARYIERSM